MNEYQWITIGIFCAIMAILIIFRKHPWVQKSWKIIVAVSLACLSIFLIAEKNKKVPVALLPESVKPSEPAITNPPITSTPSPLIVVGTDYQLSTHFNLGMLTKTEHRDLIEKNREEGKKYLDNMSKICGTILEPIWILMGPFSITSCFRCPELNSIVGGAKNSQHSVAEAADTEYTGTTLQQAFNKIAFSDIQYSQIIIEWGWIHIGFIDNILYPGKKNQKFLASQQIIDGQKKTIYTSVTKPL